jgi:hypothetical protein
VVEVVVVLETMQQEMALLADQALFFSNTQYLYLP